MANQLQFVYRWAIPAFGAYALASAAIYDVRGGTRAVIFDRLGGVKDTVVNEGTHFLVPWLQRAIVFDVRTKPRNISTTTGSKDLQMNLGSDYDERVLPSIGNEVLKAIVAQFDAAELITQREAVSNRIRTDLLKRAQEFNIALEDVSITHMTFGKEFTKAVEEKQIAQQEAERARFIVEKAEQERQASVIRAEGEAEAADTISRAVAKSGDGLIMIRRIETQKEIAQTMADNPNITYLASGESNGDEPLLQEELVNMDHTHGTRKEILRDLAAGDATNFEAMMAELLERESILQLAFWGAISLIFSSLVWAESCQLTTGMEADAYCRAIRTLFNGIRSSAEEDTVLVDISDEPMQALSPRDGVITTTNQAVEEASDKASISDFVNVSPDNLVCPSYGDLIEFSDDESPIPSAPAEPIRNNGKHEGETHGQQDHGQPSQVPKIQRTCKFWARNGSCNLSAEDCRFAHYYINVQSPSTPPKAELFSSEILRLSQEFAFFLSPSHIGETLTLPPMGREYRCFIHFLARRFKLKSESYGQKCGRYVVLTKRSGWLRFNLAIFNSAKRTHISAAADVVVASTARSPHIPLDTSTAFRKDTSFLYSPQREIQPKKNKTPKMPRLDDAGQALLHAEQGLTRPFRTFWQGFCDWALKDNVLEVALGLIIAAAFTAVVTSFVSDIILPVVSLLPFIRSNFDEWFAVLRRGESGLPYNTMEQAVSDGAVVMAYGVFLNKLFNLLGVGLSLYGVARLYGWVASDDVIKRQIKCRYCRTWISEKAKRCKGCSSWMDGREDK
ncbi:hypothetical protein FH972_021774 [Carpinus fangiana]|uniref:C3H1-type domain-containing protein n=1 Tax=Carpinus fangiana TaxID=176857 RepID=A0A5N6KQN3_9ROSI|nr:hypothetical protein FH972_021774 [Carpinus fangiana]